MSFAFMWFEAVWRQRTQHCTISVLCLHVIWSCMKAKDTDSALLWLLIYLQCTHLIDAKDTDCTMLLLLIHISISQCVDYNMEVVAAKIKSSTVIISYLRTNVSIMLWLDKKQGCSKLASPGLYIIPTLAYMWQPFQGHVHRLVG